MAENDAGRVEGRLGSAGRGISATPEHIEELRLRQAMQAKPLRGAPARAFDAVLGEQAPAKAPEAAKLSKKEARLAALPRGGPRPGGPRGPRILKG